MISRPRVELLAVLLGLAFAPTVAGAQPARLAPPATHSLLDPVRLAADFAPLAPAAPEVAPFEQAADDSTASPSDPLAPVDSASVLPAGPVMGEAEPDFDQPPIVAPVAGALVAGALGMYAGGVLGYLIVGEDDFSNDNSDISPEAVGAILIGALVGEMLALPAGAHLGNAGKGSYWSALGGSALGTVATVGFSFAGPIGTACGLALQMVLTVSAERRSAMRLAAERAAAPDAAESAAP